MASNKEISISSDDLSKEGYSALAVKTPDNKLDASRLDTEAAREEVTKLAKALTDKSSTIQNVTAADLSALLEEAQNTAQQAVTVADGGTIPEKQKSEIPADIKTAADTARLQVKNTFGNVADKEYASHLSTTRAMLIKWIPGLEVSSVEDISDALYQSDAYINKLVDYLEQQSWDNNLSLAFGVTGSWNPLNALGMLWGKINGEDEKKFAPGLYPSANIEFKTIEEKREYIKAMLQKINNVLKGKKPGEWVSAETVKDTGIVAFVWLGLYVGWKIAIGTFNAIMNKITLGLWSKWTGWLLWSDPNAINKAKKVWGLVQAWINKFRWKPTTWVAVPSTVDWATTAVTWESPIWSFQELDLTKPANKAVHEGVLRVMYNQEVANGTRPPLANPLTDSLPKDFIDGIKNWIDSANAAEYQTRINKYQSLGEAPRGNAAKMDAWKAEVNKIIIWESSPAKWNLKARWNNMGTWSAHSTDFNNRLAQVHAASQSEVIKIGSDEFKVAPAAKAPLEEIKNLQEQIAEQEAKKAELQEAKKKLESRLALEVEYWRIQQRLNVLPAEIISKENDMKTAKWAMEAHDTKYLVPADSKNPSWRKVLDTASRNVDTDYLNDKASYDHKKWIYDNLVEEQKRLIEKELPWLDTKVKQITWKPLSDITRMGSNNMTFTSNWKLRSSLTLVQYQAPRTGVLSQITVVEWEITRLGWEINTRLTNLNRINSGIPTQWKSTGVDVRMTDGTIERVTKISELFAKITKAAAKK
jgi:hypothetical protein